MSTAVDAILGAEPLDRHARTIPLGGTSWESLRLGTVDGKTLHFDLQWRRVDAPPRSAVLRDFLALAVGSDAAISEFAGRFGAIGLCEHGWPASHRPVDHVAPSAEGVCVATLAESIDRWRSIARELFSLADISAATLAGDLPLRESWLSAGIDLGICFVDGQMAKPLEAYPRLFPGPPTEWMRKIAGGHLSRWLDAAGVRPAVVATVDGFDVQIAVEGSCSTWFASVLWELALAVAGALEFHRCEHCKKLFVRPGRRHKYCSDCIERGRKTAWARRNRRKNSAEKAESRKSSKKSAKKR